MKKEHKELLLSQYRNNPRGWRQWLNGQKEIKNELESIYPFLKDIKEKLYWLNNDLTEFPRCPICNNEIKKFAGKNKGYYSHCSCKCTQLDQKVREKLKETNMKLYNNPTYNNPDKARKTCLENYGVDNIFKSEKIKEKIKNICLEKYGVENPHQNKEVIEKQKKTLIDKYGVTCGFHCANEYNKSKGEIELFDFINSLYPNAISGDRDIIFPLELDIYIPELNLGIEYDGDYWHSIPEMKIRDNLKNKICKEKNIKLIRILESEWNLNKEQIKNRLSEDLK